METVTKQVVLSTGSEPRGFGSWAFAMGRDYLRVDELAEDGKPRVVWFTGTFRECRRQAKQVARERGFDRMVVLP